MEVFHILLIFLIVILIVFFLRYNSEEGYSPPFSAHFYPVSDTKWEQSYEQMARLPYILPPVGPYSLGWNAQEKLKKEYPSQSKLFKLLHPS